MTSNSLPWFRFYSEVLSDRKIARVCYTTGQSKAVVVGVWAILLALANDSPVRGYLMISDGIPLTLEEVIMECGLDSETGESIINAFVDLKMICIEEEVYSITKWSDRQFISDNSTERVRRYRQRKREEEENEEVEPKNELDPSENSRGNALGNDTGDSLQRFSNVTETPPDTESDTESESEAVVTTTAHTREENNRITRNLKLITTKYQAMINVTFSPILADEFGEYAVKCGDPAWIEYAFAEMEAANVRNWRYAKAILDTCIANGCIRPKNGTNKTNDRSSSPSSLTPEQRQALEQKLKEKPP